MFFSSSEFIRKLIFLLLAFAIIYFLSFSFSKQIDSDRIDFNRIDSNKFEIGLYRKNGKPDLIRTINKDTILNGLTSYFYPSGTKRLDVNYRNGIKHGKTTSYFKNGEVKYSGRYTDGKPDSIWNWYSTNDSRSKHITLSESYMDGKLFGGQEEYYADSKLKLYKFYSSGGYLGFLKRDSFINKLEQRGSLFYAMINKYNLSTEEKYEMNLFVGVPSNFKSEVFLTIGLKNKNFIETLAISNKKRSRNSDFFFHEKKFRNGSYTLSYIINIYDDLCESIYLDTLKIEIQVSD